MGWFVGWRCSSSKRFLDWPYGPYMAKVFISIWDMPKSTEVLKNRFIHEENSLGKSHPQSWLSCCRKSMLWMALPIL
jgi:hypothetical protein